MIVRIYDSARAEVAIAHSCARASNATRAFTCCIS